MPGLVLVTDKNWFDFLRAQPVLDEANFWQPAGPRPLKRLKPGDPVFFKHHKEDGGAIAGLGFYASFSASQVWLAWDAFGPKNGAPDYPTFCRMIGSRQRKLGVARGRIDDVQIGCIMLASPVFFSASAWVAGPKDWADPIVTGKYYDLDAGEGARIWQECQQRLPAQTLISEGSVPSVPETERYGNPIMVKPRRGQGIFRLDVTAAYTHACAVTGEHSLPALEAAHIRPYADGGTHEIENGLLLRSDIHRLFDKGYLAVTPDHRFLVGKGLKDDFSNGHSYYPLNGKEIRLPAAVFQHPNAKLLQWHLENKFRG